MISLQEAIQQLNQTNNKSALVKGWQQVERCYAAAGYELSLQEWLFTKTGLDLAIVNAAQEFIYATRQSALSKAQKTTLQSLVEILDLAGWGMAYLIFGPPVVASRHGMLNLLRVCRLTEVLTAQQLVHLLATQRNKARDPKTGFVPADTENVEKMLTDYRAKLLAKGLSSDFPVPSSPESADVVRKSVVKPSIEGPSSPLSAVDDGVKLSMEVDQNQHETSQELPSHVDVEPNIFLNKQQQHENPSGQALHTTNPSGIDSTNLDQYDDAHINFQSQHEDSDLDEPPPMKSQGNRLSSTTPHIGDDSGYISESNCSKAGEGGKHPKNKINDTMQQTAVRPGTQAVVSKSNLEPTVEKREYASLDGTAWLNDEVVNSCISLVVGDFPHHRTHHFSSFFFTNLLSSGYDSVKKWTKRIKILDYEFTIVPINSNENHWSLAIIRMIRETCNDTPTISILTMDNDETQDHANDYTEESRNRFVYGLLAQYVVAELADKSAISIRTEDITWRHCGDTPSGQNENDCGIFTLLNLERFLRNPMMFESSVDRPPWVVDGQQERARFRSKLSASNVLQNKESHPQQQRAQSHVSFRESSVESVSNVHLEMLLDFSATDSMSIMKMLKESLGPTLSSVVVAETGPVIQINTIAWEMGLKLSSEDVEKILLSRLKVADAAPETPSPRKRTYHTFTSLDTLLVNQLEADQSLLDRSIVLDGFFSRLKEHLIGIKAETSGEICRHDDLLQTQEKLLTHILEDAMYEHHRERWQLDVRGRIAELCGIRDELKKVMESVGRLNVKISAMGSLCIEIRDGLKGIVRVDKADLRKFVQEEEEIQMERESRIKRLKLLY